MLRGYCLFERCYITLTLLIITMMLIFSQSQRVIVIIGAATLLLRGCYAVIATRWREATLITMLRRIHYAMSYYAAAPRYAALLLAFALSVLPIYGREPPTFSLSLPFSLNTLLRHYSPAAARFFAHA